MRSLIVISSAIVCVLGGVDGRHGLSFVANNQNYLRTSSLSFIRGGEVPASHSVVNENAADDEIAKATPNMRRNDVYTIMNSPAASPPSTLESTNTCTLGISSGFKSGQKVVLKGRRGKSVVCIVRIGKGCADGEIMLSSNTANNLKLSPNEQVKVTKLSKNDVPDAASEILIHPIEDSIVALENLVNEGDPLDDEVLNGLVEGFVGVEEEGGVAGYVSDGDIFTIVNEAGEKLDVLVKFLEADEDEGDASEDDKKLSQKPAHPFKQVASTTTVTLAAPLERPPVTAGYESVGGNKKNVALIRELIEMPLRFPELWTAAGVSTPKGVLLHGPPGSGKTLIVNALCEETGAEVISINGPEIMATKGGESEQNLRKAFEEAAEKAPAIIFMDEIDSIAPKRDATQGETEKRMVSQLLTLMDNLPSNVMVLGATNRPNVIESALRRPGRFDRELDVGIPDEEGREEILRIKTKGMRMSPDADLAQIARDTHGYVGADIAQLTLEAALQCIREHTGGGINSEDGAVSIDEELLLDVESSTTFTEKQLDNLVITNSHLLHGLQNSNPSSLRESAVEVPDTSWADIGGLEKTKRELQEMVRYPIEHRGLFEKFGMHASRGVLFYGPPGCGKTLMAKAIANECGANFLSVKGPELLNMWFGGSEANVRDLFNKARAASPCILFFDEIDSIARARGSGGGGSSETSDRVINQILSEIDGIGGGKTLFIIAATNRPDILDPAITRPGRIDQLIEIPLPDYESRLSIFKASLRKSPVSPDVDFAQLATATEGFSGADISEVCQRSAKNAIRDSIAAGIARQKRVENGELTQEEADKMEDAVRYITREHFEASMANARKSVTPEVAKIYSDFSKSISSKWGGSEGEKGEDCQETVGDTTEAYDIDRAEREFEKDDLELEA